MHSHSQLAYATTAPERQTLEDRIMGLMADGKARTDRQIAHELGILDCQYRPRINELVNEGLLHEVGSTTCKWTNKKVRLTKRFL
jgi:predicted HTH transcriptional regulator